jgi:glutamate 5-kinase
MATKVEAAAIATAAGITTMLTSTAQAAQAMAGQDVGTLFVPTGSRRASRLLWLAHATTARGRLILDDGAVAAVVDRRKSLLPAGIVRVEGRFGDNDRLAALVAHLVNADALVLLSDVDALYDGPPSRAGTSRVPLVRGPVDLKNIRVRGTGTGVGTGGMATKVEAAAIATAAGITTMLTSTAFILPQILQQWRSTRWGTTTRTSRLRGRNILPPSKRLATPTRDFLPSTFIES